MRRAAYPAAIGVALLLATLPAAAQEPGEPLGLRLEQADTRAHPNVTLVVNVPAAVAKRELGVEAFTITENDQEIAPTAVEKVPTASLDVVLLIDTSGSMTGEPLSQAQAAGAAFVEELPNDVEVAVAGFGEEATVVAEFGEPRDATIAAIEGLRSSGETALYDGLIAASSLFARQGADEESRRVLVLLSDGGDTVSTLGLDDAILALIGVDAGFYAVELVSAEVDHAALERLASATEGTVVPADDPAALSGTFDEIGALIVNQYVLTYESVSFETTDVVVTAAAGTAVASLTATLRFPEAPPPAAPPPTSAAQPVAPAAEPDPAPILLPDPRHGSPVVLGWLQSTQARTVGLAILFVALIGLAIIGLRGSHRARVAAADMRKLMKTRERTKLATLTEHVAQYAERTLSRAGRQGRIEAALEAAGSQLRVGEYIVVAASLGLVGFAAGQIAKVGPLVAIGIGTVAVLGSWVWLLDRGRKRQAAFAEQLQSTLQLMAGSLRAGFGLVQAIDVVAEEAQSPTSDEFYRVKVETHLGRDLHEALKAMTARVGGNDFEWVVEGIRIHREVGGDLAEIIDQVAETVRDRARLRRQVKALTAEGRMSAIVLVLVPLFLAGAMAVMNPDYLGELNSSIVGRAMAVAGVVLVIVGFFWMRKLIKIEI